MYNITTLLSFEELHHLSPEMELSLSCHGWWRTATNDEYIWWIPKQDYII